MCFDRICLEDDQLSHFSPTSKTHKKDGIVSLTEKSEVFFRLTCNSQRWLHLEVGVGPDSLGVPGRCCDSFADFVISRFFFIKPRETPNPKNPN